MMPKGMMRFGCGSERMRNGLRFPGGGGGTVEFRDREVAAQNLFCPSLCRESVRGGGGWKEGRTKSFISRRYENVSPMG